MFISPMMNNEVISTSANLTCVIVYFPTFVTFVAPFFRCNVFFVRRMIGSHHRIIRFRSFSFIAAMNSMRLSTPSCEKSTCSASSTPFQ